MTRHRIISSIHKLALGTLKLAVLTLGTLATIALFCSCRSSDIATRESDTLNRMQETVSQDSIHVSQLRFDSVIVERYFTVEKILDTVYIKQESNKQHFSILRDTVYVARSDTIVRAVEVIKEKEVVKTAPQRKSFKSYLICIFASILLFLAIYFLIRSRFRLWVSKCQSVKLILIQLDVVFLIMT